jgi:hypothetical protein
MTVENMIHVPACHFFDLPEIIDQPRAAVCIETIERN